jgi:hypothetical protein
MGDVVLHRDRGDERLRAVAACHPYDIGSLRDGAPGELAEVVVASEQQSFDVAPSCLGGKIEAFGLPTTRVGIDDQYASLRRLRGARVPARYVHRRVRVTHGISGHKPE